MGWFANFGTVRRDRVKAPILVPFTLVLVFVVGVFVATAYVFEKRQHSRDLSSSARAVEELFARELARDTMMMRGILAAVTRNEDIKTTFLAGDRQALSRLVRPLFENLRQGQHVTHFYFTGPDRVNFLRVHQPGRHGDMINRVTTLGAEATGEITDGVELGPLGTLTLRVVFPWMHDGKLIGYLELGEEVDPIIAEIRNIVGVDLEVIIYKKHLNRRQWETGMKMLGRQPEWDRFRRSVGIGAKTGEFPAVLTNLVDEGDHPYGVPLELKGEGKTLSVAFLPFYDAAETELGDMVVLRDVTELQKFFFNSMGLIAVLCVLAGAAAFVLFYFILDRVERDYRHQREVESQLSTLSREHERIVQMEKLSAMGMMVGEIAHQINNPLVGVVNMAQLAEREADDAVRTRELLGHIRKAGEHCRAFLQRMLQFTTISRSARKATDMKTLIDDTVTLFQQSTKGSAHVETVLPDDAVTLQVDPVLVRHALFNLLSNAAQADRNDGTITVSLAPSEDGSPDWILSVSDRGPGLADDIKDDIFKPFFSTRAEGTGLGLPVVQHVAMSHGGTITATNTASGGACFALRIPDIAGEAESEAKDSHR